MAGTVTLIAASNNSLRYVYTAPGAGTNDDLTQTRMIVDCAAGQLKAKLEDPATFGTTTDQQVAWSETALDPSVSIAIAGQVTPCLAGYDFRTVSSDNVIHLAATGAGAVYVEIRFHPTLVR